ncbi:MAG: response regulator [Candidatus Zixiibacteriota bacterium]
MTAALPNILAPLLVLLLLAYIAWRLRIAATIDLAGRVLYVVGALLLFLAASWQWAEAVKDYRTWFVVTAYPLIDLAQFLIAAIALALIAMALSRRETLHRDKEQELQLRETHLSVLTNLQQDGRHRHQLLELLNMTLKEVLVPLPNCVGAIFLMNRTKRQLILGAWHGLSKAEIAALEHLSLDIPMVRQSIELGDPAIAGSIDGGAAPGNSELIRFRSTLILPLSSGIENIGVLLLLSEQADRFGRSDVRSLAPVADWLSEKIHSARLVREMSLLRQDSETATLNNQELVQRLQAASRAYGSIDPIVQFCRSIVGMFGSSEVFLGGVRDARLVFHGGSEAIDDLTENYRVALLEALERRKPLVINQEAVDSGGRSRVTRSTLLFPIGGDDLIDALMLRREAGPFSVDEKDLQTLSLMASLGKLIMGQQTMARRDLARRVGLEKVLQLLRAGDRVLSFDTDPTFLSRHLSDLLPIGSLLLMLVRNDKGSYHSAVPALAGIDMGDLCVQPGESLIGQAAVNRQPQFAGGRKSVESGLAGMDQTNRNVFEQLFGEEGPADFAAVCPVTHDNKTVGLLVVFIRGIGDAERMEWERLLTLAVYLYSFLLSVEATRKRSMALVSEMPVDDRLAQAVNELNNHLSAVIGTADLASQREDLAGDVRLQLVSIVDEAERAAAIVKEAVTPLHSGGSPGAAGAHPTPTLNDIVSAVLGRLHVSAGLYLAGGKAREISRRTSQIGPVPFAEEALTEFFEELLNRFAAVSADDDIITIATYAKEEYVYLDISRHRRNFPPVERVADFGQYQIAEQAFRDHPGDVFLRHVAQGVCYFAADRVSPSPAYLSFKFPAVSESSTAERSGSESAVRVLAIDDQPVILDLIAAMCQSLGYAVVTAQSGQEGIRRAVSGRFDIVLTDLAMPDMSGIEVARQIRKLHSDTPIVLVTGWEANLDRAALTSSGISDVLYKPFRIEQLTDLITAAAKSK